MTIQIVVYTGGTKTRIECFDGLVAALEVAAILNRESGKGIEVVVNSGDGEHRVLLLEMRGVGPPVAEKAL